MAMRIWQFLNTDIKELFSLDTVDGTVDAAEATFKLAETLEKQDIQDLAPWIDQGASLLDVLNTPEAELAESVLPFAKIATGLLKFYLQKTKQTPTFAQCVVLVCFKAYSESLIEFVKDISVTGQPGKADFKQLELKDFEIEEAEANRTLVCFHRSKLADFLRELMSERLQQVGLETEQAQLLTERAAWNTHRYITKAWSELPDEARRFAPTSMTDWRREQEKYESIDIYLQEYISPHPTDPIRQQRWQVFNEPFTFKAIYVPLQAKPLDRNGEEDEDEEPIGLESWAKTLLNDPAKSNRVLFIQAGPGRGKSVFCRIFAEWVRENLHPIWTPILIRLRDIPKLQNSFEDTLREAVNADFAKSDDGWLTDRNTRFLFLLDGFDELLMEGRTSGGLEQFLRQVGQFQRDCTTPERGHRVIVTGRTLALHAVERVLPSNLERVKVLPMEDEERRQWFEKWATLAGLEKAQQFQEFLCDPHCPERLKGSADEIGLAQEPLLLYLLAAMHRDGELNLETFAGADSAKAKVLIYQKSLDWVLTKQRPDLLNRDLTELETDGLKRILAEAGLCVVQSGGECAAIRMIEERLKTNDQARTLLEEAQNRLKENPLRNALAAFYLQPGRKGEGSVEFAHKSFSEFLCAERLKQSIEDWTYPGRRNRFEISDEQLHWEIYDLLGAPVLTPEIVEYLMALLQESADFKAIELFNRLHDFYLRWCESEFMDRLPAENLPQKKMLQLRDLAVTTGLRQVDVYTGLNVMILLFKLHAAAQPDPEAKSQPASTPQIMFYPCGQPDTESFNEDRLVQIIHYADALGWGTFSTVVGAHLACANLASANLESINLANANLVSANLDGVNLYSADLDSTDLDSANLNSATIIRADLTNANLASTSLNDADLSSANLTRTNLYSATLYRVDLSGADLISANLREADLYRAYLASANLYGVNLNGADLEDISWNEETNWKGVQGLETARNVPEKLKQQLGLD